MENKKSGLASAELSEGYLPDNLPRTATLPNLPAKYLFKQSYSASSMAAGQHCLCRRPYWSKVQREGFWCKMRLPAWFQKLVTYDSWLRPLSATTWNYQPRMHFWLSALSGADLQAIWLPIKSQEPQVAQLVICVT